MILAGLAHACGAHETAQALVRDSIELSIYAGCDTTQPVTSRLQKDLNLASSLRLPEIVFGDNSDTVPLNALALLRLKSWADANNLSTRIIANDSLSRKGLWAFWQSRVQASPFLSSLQQPPTKGSGWPQQLDEWISQRSKIARQRIAAVDAELRDANEVKQKKDDQDKLYHAVDN